MSTDDIDSGWDDEDEEDDDEASHEDVDALDSGWDTPEARERRHKNAEEKARARREKAEARKTRQRERLSVTASKQKQKQRKTKPPAEAGGVAKTKRDVTPPRDVAKREEPSQRDKRTERATVKRPTFTRSLPTMLIAVGIIIAIAAIILFVVKK